MGVCLSDRDMLKTDCPHSLIGTAGMVLGLVRENDLSWRSSGSLFWMKVTSALTKEIDLEYLFLLRQALNSCRDVRACFLDISGYLVQVSTVCRTECNR